MSIERQTMEHLRRRRIRREHDYVHGEHCRPDQNDFGRLEFFEAALDLSIRALNDMPGGATSDNYGSPDCDIEAPLVVAGIG